ncbi:MAG TPA: hypothetical protein VNL71_19080 [Chloroflexota bacterium]|nr:hypothetical protein [Chloroflexota bacterium]
MVKSNPAFDRLRATTAAILEEWGYRRPESRERIWPGVPGDAVAPEILAVRQELTRELLRRLTLQDLESARWTAPPTVHGLAYEQVMWRHGLDNPWIPGGVGDGWAELVDRLFVDLRSLGWDGRLSQIKEKYGTLRVYLARSTTEMEDRILAAEEESATICEICGATGRLLEERAWIAARCDRHAAAGA